MLKLTTSGESHGRALTAIIEGLPSNLTVETEEIDRYLALRQGGYGRGARQKIETDRVQILAGVRDKKTLGSPVCLVVENRDYANWEAYSPILPNPKCTKAFAFVANREWTCCLP